MEAYIQIPGPDAATADKLEARVRQLAEQVGVSYERLFTVQHAADVPADALTFDACVLAYFDTKAMGTRFNRLTGTNLTESTAR